MNAKLYSSSSPPPSTNSCLPLTYVIFALLTVNTPFVLFASYDCFTAFCTGTAKTISQFKKKVEMPTEIHRTGVYPKVSGLAAWSENCKWYSSLPLGAVCRYLMSQSSEFCRHNPLCCFWTSVFLYLLSPETFGYTRTYILKMPSLTVYIKFIGLYVYLFHI
jgi:hypothetical protein